MSSILDSHNSIQRPLADADNDNHNANDIQQLQNQNPNPNQTHYSLNESMSSHAPNDSVTGSVSLSSARIIPIGFDLPADESTRIDEFDGNSSVNDHRPMSHWQQSATRPAAAAYIESVTLLELELSDRDLLIKQLQSKLNSFQSSSPSQPAPAAAAADRLLASLESSIDSLTRENISLKSEVYTIRAAQSLRIHEFLQKHAKFERRNMQTAETKESAPPDHFRSLSLGTIKMLAGAMKSLNSQYSSVNGELAALKLKERRYQSGIRVTSESLQKLAAASQTMRKANENRIATQNQISQLRRTNRSLNETIESLRISVDSSQVELISLREELKFLRPISDKRAIEFHKKIKTEISRNAAHASQSKSNQFTPACNRAFQLLDSSILVLDRNRLTRSAADAISAIEVIKKEFQSIKQKLDENERREDAIMEFVKQMQIQPTTMNSNENANATRGNEVQRPNEPIK